MRFTFPVSYRLEGRKPGKRVFRPYRFHETVSIEVPEITGAEAPVAVAWPCAGVPERRKVKDWSIGCGDADGMQLTRWFGGCHWLRLVEGHVQHSWLTEKPSTRELDVATAASHLAAGTGQHGIGLNLAVRWPRNPAKEVQGDPTASFDETRNNGRDAAMAAVEKACQDLLLVDGVLHRACAQPGIRSEYFRGDSGLALRWPLVETRASILDGIGGLDHSGFVCVSYPLSWDGYQRGFDPSPQGLEVMLPESIDPDIEIARHMETAVKAAILESGGGPAVIPALLEYFGEETPTRARRLLELVESEGGRWIADEALLSGLLRDLREGDENLSVPDVMAVAAAPRP